MKKNIIVNKNKLFLLKKKKFISNVLLKLNSFGKKNKMIESL